jgi:hypothetical protein
VLKLPLGFQALFSFPLSLSFQSLALLLEALFCLLLPTLYSFLVLSL